MAGIIGGNSRRRAQEACRQPGYRQEADDLVKNQEGRQCDKRKQDGLLPRKPTERIQMQQGKDDQFHQEQKKQQAGDSGSERLAGLLPR